MHFILVGPGALGCLLATVLTDGLQPGDQLTVLDHNPNRAELLNRNGITCLKDDSERIIPVTAASDPIQLEPADVVLFCVKSYDLTRCIDYCRPLLESAPLILFLQNGIGHLDLSESCAPASAAYGTTTEGATLLGPAMVRHAGRGITSLGFLQPQPPAFQQKLEALSHRLSAGGFEIQETTNILNRLWAKLFVNVGINALTAIEGCLNGELLKREETMQRMEAAVNEAMQVAKSRDIEVMNDPLSATRIVCARTAKNVSSMLQDIRGGKKTEINAINGAVVDLARPYNIPTPENQALVDAVHVLERQHRES